MTSFIYDTNNTTMEDAEMMVSVCTLSLDHGVGFCVAISLELACSCPRQSTRQVSSLNSCWDCQRTDRCPTYARLSCQTILKWAIRFLTTRGENITIFSLVKRSRHFSELVMYKWYEELSRTTFQYPVTSEKLVL